MHFSPFSTHFSPFSSHFSASPKGQGQTTAIYCKNGEFHSDPVCTDPVQNFQNIWAKSSFQYRMKFSIENEIFIPGPSLAAEKQGLGLKFSIGNEFFKPRMKISSENENFVRAGMFFFFMRSSENEFFRSPGPLGKSFGELFWPQRKTFQVSGGYKIPMKTRKTISTTEIFPLWPPFSSAKKSSALEQGGVCFLFPSRG